MPWLKRVTAQEWSEWDASAWMAAWSSGLTASNPSIQTRSAQNPATQRRVGVGFDLTLRNNTRSERTHHSRHVKCGQFFRADKGFTKLSFLVAVSPEKRPFRLSKKSPRCGLLMAHFSQLVTVARDDKKGSRAFDWPVVRTRAWSLLGYDWIRKKARIAALFFFWRGASIEEGSCLNSGGFRWEVEIARDSRPVGPIRRKVRSGLIGCLRRDCPAGTANPLISHSEW